MSQDSAGQHHDGLVEQLWRWVDTVVIGLNLCPFAAGPRRRGQVRLMVSDATSEHAVLAALTDEMIRLDDTPPEQLDTTLLAIPDLWPDFLPFNDFLQQADALLVTNDRDGVYQIASFHPHYQFAGAAPGAAENLTNRAPCPILHLLREDRVADAVARYPDTELIPQQNIAALEALSPAQQKALFPWLKDR